MDFDLSAEGPELIPLLFFLPKDVIKLADDTTIFLCVYFIFLLFHLALELRNYFRLYLFIFSPQLVDLQA